MNYESYPTKKTMKRKSRKSAKHQIFVTNKQMSKKYLKRKEEKGPK